MSAAAFAYRECWQTWGPEKANAIDPALLLEQPFFEEFEEKKSSFAELCATSGGSSASYYPIRYAVAASSACGQAATNEDGRLFSFVQRFILL